MKPIKILSLITVFLLMSIAYLEKPAAGEESAEAKYFDFMNMFFPGSPDYTIHIEYKPDGVVDVHSGEITNITIEITKINMTRKVDFYLRFIITRGFWCPYNPPSSSSNSFIKRLKDFNYWLNTTVPLTQNLYTLTPSMAHFTENMTNLTINLMFKIHGRGNDWGLSILGRPSNASLWIPIGGVPLNVRSNDCLYEYLPWIVTFTIIFAVTALSILVKTRKLPKFKKSII